VASKKLISSTSREQVSLKQFWNEPQEREISYTSQQNEIPQIKNRKEKNDNSQCEHPATPIKKMQAKQNSSFLTFIYLMQYCCLLNQRKSKLYGHTLIRINCRAN
jgi:uncharacterized membrane protein YfhO